VEGDGGDIGLTVGSPVDFNVGGRWDAGGEAEVGAEAEAADASGGAVEVGPRAKEGGGAVGADDPASGDGLTGEAGGLARVKDDRGVEGKADAERGGAVAEELVESGATEASAVDGGEVGGDTAVGVGESDACEGEAVGVGEDAEGGEGAARFGHESLAAGFVDRGTASVGEEDVGAAKAEGDGGGESGRTCSGDEYVTVVVTHDSSAQRSVWGSAVSKRDWTRG
jgi:hypothetical protein